MALQSLALTRSTHTMEGHLPCGIHQTKRLLITRSEVQEMQWILTHEHKVILCRNLENKRSNWNEPRTKCREQCTSTYIFTKKQGRIIILGYLTFHQNSAHFKYLGMTVTNQNRIVPKQTCTNILIDRISH
jgi:hypothetical protein